MGYYLLPTNEMYCKGYGYAGYTTKSAIQMTPTRDLPVPHEVYKEVYDAAVNKIKTSKAPLVLYDVPIEANNVSEARKKAYETLEYFMNTYDCALLFRLKPVMVDIYPTVHAFPDAWQFSAKKGSLIKSEGSANDDLQPTIIYRDEVIISINSCWTDKAVELVNESLDSLRSVLHFDYLKNAKIECIDAPVSVDMTKKEE